MKLVIDIPEEFYKHSCETGFLCWEWMTMLELTNAIKNGTPLPKEHGRLKDIDAFITKVKADRKHSAYLRSWTADDVLNALDNSYAPTIIEAEEVE